MSEKKQEKNKFEETQELEVDTENLEHMEASEEENDVSNEETPETSEVLEDQQFEEMNIEGQKAGENLEDVVKTFMSSKKKLIDENKKLVNELETLKDRLLRTNAEYENFRKRTIKEKEGIYTDACEDVLKNMLPVLDNLERAYTVNGSVDDIKKGIEMTIRQFKDSLGKLQVEEIASEGEFDPNLHNAVMHVEDETLGNNSIVEVFQKGYMRANKVIRHSMVKVAN